MTKILLEEKKGVSTADVNGKAADLVELLATIMNSNETFASLILAATEVYRTVKDNEEE